MVTARVVLRIEGSTSRLMEPVGTICHLRTEVEGVDSAEGELSWR